MQTHPHVIWVCQWYPHEGDPYAGDFIQRHARATSLYIPITTFSCFAHSANKVETHSSGSLTEHIIYFKTIKTGINIIDKIWYWGNWYRNLKKQIAKHIHQNGKPDLLHCHIILNAGWLGLWAKRKYGIPYMVTEHWSGYMPGAVNGFARYNQWSKRLFSCILGGAKLATAVSQALIQVLEKLHPQCIYVRLPNVVEDTIFKRSAGKRSGSVFRVVHISTFSTHKNMDDTFTAFDALAALSSSVELHIVGPQEKITEKWPHRKFDAAYIFHKEMPQVQLAELMQQCDVAVLYSHYETFGCVIIEANAAGLPVIVSDIPVLREVIEHEVNGVLVEANNPSALTQALIDVRNKRYHFNPLQISNRTLELFSFQAVGKQMAELYQQVLDGRY